MDIKIIKRIKNDVKIEVEGEGHTYCNILQKTLIKNKDVEFAGYNVPHPLTNKAIIRLKVKGNKKPEKILVAAAKEISAEADEFKEKIVDAIEKYKPKAE